MGGQPRPASLARGPNTDLKDSNRKLPHAALYRLQGTQISKNWNTCIFRATLYKASCPSPQPHRAPRALPSVPLVVSPAHAFGGLFPVYLSCRNGSDRPSTGIRTACFVLSFPPALSSPPAPANSPVQSKGFYFALCNSGQLILSWLCSQIAVSGQRPLGLPPPSPSSQPAHMHVQPWFSLHHSET